MKKKIWKRLILAALGLVVIGAIVLALLPKPVAIETAKVGRGDLRVVIEAEGRTRVHDRYLVAAR